MENCSLSFFTNFINQNIFNNYIVNTATILSVLFSGFIASIGALYMICQKQRILIYNL